MSGRSAFRLAALGFAALAILVGVMSSRQPSPAPQPLAAAPPAFPTDAALTRCQALGAAGAQDDACLKAWADQRAKFLRPTTPVPQKGR